MSSFLLSVLHNPYSPGADTATASPGTANITNSTETAPPPVPSCMDACTKCEERVDPFLAADPTCRACSRIAPEEEGRELGACVLFGPQTASPLNGPTAGGYVLTITGEFFGVSASAPGVSAKVGETSCGGLEWISRTSISCKVPAGVGTTKVSVAIGNKGDGSWTGQCTNCGVFVSMSEDTFKYDPPTVSKAKQPSKGYCPPEGNFPVTLTGTGFGTFDTADKGLLKGVVESFYGGDAAPTIATWTSDSSVIVKAPEGVGAKRPIWLIVGGQSSSCADAQPAMGAQTAPPPAEQSANSSQTETGGGRRLLEGENAQLADSAQTTTPPPAKGGSGDGTEVVGGGNGDASADADARGTSEGICSAATIDYDIPYLKRIRPALSPRDGGRKVTLRGSGFGPAPPSPANALKVEVEPGERRDSEEVEQADSGSADNLDDVDTAAHYANTNTSSSATNSSTPADAVGAQGEGGVGGANLVDGRAGQVKASTKGMAAKIGETECVTV
jgi:hypothetical protein